MEERVAIAEREGYAVSEEEIEGGVWAASAPVLQGKRMTAVLTVPSPLVRTPAALRRQLIRQVITAAESINTRLRAARR